MAESSTLSTYASREGHQYDFVALESTFALEWLIHLLLKKVKLAELILSYVAFLLLPLPDKVTKVLHVVQTNFFAPFALRKDLSLSGARFYY